jgi:hypothetical protein
LGEELFREMCELVSINATSDISSTALENGDYFIKEYTEKCY